MKFKRISDGALLNVADETAIKRFQGYPDMFEEIKEVEVKTETKAETKVKTKEKK